MSFQNSSNDLKAQRPLLKVSQPSYGTRSSPSGSGEPTSSALENGRHAPIPPAELDESTMRLKQYVASIGIALSGGSKLVHVALQVWRTCFDLAIL
jgi:hypothetical protein